MRIAIVFPHLPLTEEERTTYERSLRERYLSARLNLEGEHTCLLCYLTHHDEPFVLNSGKDEAHFFPIDSNTREKARKFFTSVSLGNRLKAFAPDLVVFKGMGYMLPWWLLKHRYIVPRIAFIAGGNPEDILLPMASFVFSEYRSQLLRPYASHARKGRAALLGKYVPDEDFDSESDRSIDVISVGSVSKLKNHRALIPLFGKCSIIIVGDGPELPVLKAAAQGYENITFIGEVPKEKVSEYIRKAKIMVHPSRFEGFPRVFAEAFACGVPVIALKRAIRGEFPNESAGILVEEPELQTTVSDLLSDPDRLSNLSKNALKLAENSYRGELIYSQFLSGIETAVVQKFPRSMIIWRSLRLPLRQGVWLFDYYLFLWGRQMKNRLLSLIRR